MLDVTDLVVFACSILLFICTSLILFIQYFCRRNGIYQDTNFVRFVNDNDVESTGDMLHKVY